MRTVRKMLAFMLAAGLMVSSMLAFAEGSTSGTYNGGTWEKDEWGDTTYKGSGDPSKDSNVQLKEGDIWHPTGTFAYGSSASWTNGAWDVYKDSFADSDSGSDSGSGSGSSRSDSDSGSHSKSVEEREAEARAEAEATAERLAWEEAGRGAVRLAGVASDEGFEDIGDMFRAAEKSMSAGEFYNNVVVNTPGIENAMTVGQGGNLIVDGQVTNMTASIGKVTNRAYVDSVRIEQEGTVLNVVEVSYPATEATINFYTPGITGEENIVALQYNAGAWVDVEVAEVRADHVTLNLKGNGVVAFIAK